MSENYMYQENRNKKVKELRNKGYVVRKTSIRNQLLHPAYVKDYPNQSEKNDNGFGNTLYKTYFKSLYSYVIIEKAEYL